MTDSKHGDLQSGDQPLRLCMISGSIEYDSEDSLSLFADYVSGEYPIQPTMIVYRTEDDDVSLVPIDDADVLLVFTRRLNVKGAELDRFKRYCDAGKPIVGVRTASYAFQNWLDFDREVLGGSYDLHWDDGPLAAVKFEAAAAGHVLLGGVSEFASRGSLYRNTPIADDTELLMTGVTDDHSEPVTWTRSNRGGRVFYTSLGHQQDFREPSFLRLLANAVMWCGGRV